MTEDKSPEELEHLIELAKRNADTVIPIKEQITTKQTHYFAEITNFIKSLELSKGQHKVNPTDLYQFYVQWTPNTKPVNYINFFRIIPSFFKPHKSNNIGRYYLLNQSTLTLTKKIEALQNVPNTQEKDPEKQS